MNSSGWKLWSRIFPTAGILFFAVTAGATPTAEELRKIGCKVTEKGGAVVELSAEAEKFGEAEFRMIGQLASLNKLSLSGKSLTDETLPLLAGLGALEDLSTNGSQLSDAGYKHFAAFSNLVSLALWHPSFGGKQFTGTGLAELHALPNLRKLTFAGSTAGDAAMEAVGKLTQLREFSTWHTAQTQAGNAHLLALTNLVSLRIGQRLPPWGKSIPPSFDEATLATLVKISSLESLSLMEARLTGKALEQLKALPKLQKLSIQTTDISAADVDALRRVLPSVKIDFKPLTDEEREGTLVKKLRL